MQVEHLHAALKRHHAHLTITTCYLAAADGTIVFTDVRRAAAD